MSDETTERTWVDDAYDEIAAMTPESGYNVVGVNGMAMAGEALYFVGHYDDAETAENARAIHEERTGDTSYVYAPSDVDGTDIERTDYNPDQPRDERGRFGDGGGSSAGGWKGSASGAKDTESAFKSGGKWPPERVAIHSAYVDKALSGVPKSKLQTVYMTGGGPASGKTSALLKNPEAHIPDSKSAAHINADDAKEHIPEYEAGKVAGDPMAASFVHEESAHMSQVGIERAIRDGHDVVYDSTGDGSLAKLTGKVAAMRAMGVQRVVAAYSAIDPAEAIRRSDARFAMPESEGGGRYVPHEVIRATHAEVAKTATAAIRQGVFDEAQVWDNNGKKAVLIASYDKAQGLKILDQKAWNAFEFGTSVEPRK